MIDTLEQSLEETASNWGTARIVSYEGVTPALNPGNPQIEVTAEKVQDAVLRFRDETVTVLNFASGVNPGGGVRHGAVAQEEDLCRCSGLLHGLEALSGFYDRNQAEEAPPECYDMMIVSEDVPLVRTGRGTRVPTTFMKVLTYPAPNLYRGMFLQQPTEAGFHAEDRGELLHPQDVRDIFERRCAHIMHQAGILNTKVLILGAWGCGAYGNDPVLVAQEFQKALTKYSGTIPRVVFACYGESSNREAFQHIFPG